MGKRVRFQNVNTTQGVDTSTTRPVEVAQSPEVIKTQASSKDTATKNFPAHKPGRDARYAKELKQS